MGKKKVEESVEQKKSYSFMLDLCEKLLIEQVGLDSFMTYMYVDGCVGYKNTNQKMEAYLAPKRDKERKNAEERVKVFLVQKQMQETGKLKVCCLYELLQTFERKAMRQELLAKYPDLA
jgi:hypothetical protein